MMQLHLFTVTTSPADSSQSRTNVDPNLWRVMIFIVYIQQCGFTKCRSHQKPRAKVQNMIK